MSDLLTRFQEIEREFSANTAATSASRRRMRAACVVMLDQLKPHVKQKTIALQAGVSPSRISEIKRGVYRMPNLPVLFEALLVLWKTHCADQPEQRRVNASKATDWIGGGK